MMLSGHRRYQQLSTGHGRRGSYGTVAIAIILVTQGTVAIKRQRLPSDTAQNEFAAYCALRRWPRPNVQRMVDHYVAGDGGHNVLHTVHDFFDSTLWRLYKSDVVQAGALPRKRWWSLLQGLSSGVAHLHHIGIVHADLTLSNICLGDGDAVTIVDMGGVCDGHSMIAAVPITTAYVRAPEAWVAEEAASPTPVSFPVDNFSFGVVAMCLLTGRCPWMIEAPEAGVAAALAALAAVLGPITEESWPGRGELPGWEKFAALHGESLRAARGREGTAPERIARLNERRPLQPDDLDVNIVEQYLRWGPGLRATAKAFGEPAGDDKAADVPASRAASPLRSGATASSADAAPPTTPGSCEGASMRPPASACLVLSTGAAAAAPRADPETTLELGAAGRCQCKGLCGNKVHRRILNAKAYRGSAQTATRGCRSQTGMVNGHCMSFSWKNCSTNEDFAMRCNSISSMLLKFGDAMRLLRCCSPHVDIEQFLEQLTLQCDFPSCKVHACRIRSIPVASRICSPTSAWTRGFLLGGCGTFRWPLRFPMGSFGRT